MAWRSRIVTREVLVVAWLALAFGFLWVRLPGFWRSPYERFVAAQQLDAQGRTSDAAAEMGMAIDEEPDNVGYLVYVGHLRLRLNQASQAERAFAAALEHGSNPEASLGLARARQARPRDAKVILDGLSPSVLTHAQRFRRLSQYAAIGDFRGALSDADLLATSPASTAEKRDALRWAMAGQDWPRAVRLAEDIEAGAIDDALRLDVRRDRAIALRATGRFEEALALFDVAPTPETLEARAQLALQLGKFQQAAELYSEVATAAPGDGQSRMALAYALERAGRLGAAEAVYRTALEDAGSDARIKLATLLNALRRHREAWQILEPLSRPSRDVDTLRLQARTAAWSGQLADALQLFVALGGNRTSDDNLYEADLAGALRQAGEIDASDRLYERLLRDDTLGRAHRLAYADSLTERQRFDDAWRVLETVAPGDDDLVGRRARVAVWSRRYATARPLLDAWLAGHPGDAERWQDAAETARQIEDPAAESAALGSYLALRPADQVATIRRAGLLERLDKPDEALALYRAALEREPNRADVHRVAGYLSERAGARDQAVHDYSRAWELTDPKDRALALAIARLQRADAPDEAVVWYARADQTTISAGERHQVQVGQAKRDIASGNSNQAAMRLASVLLENGAHVDALVSSASLETSRGNALAAVAHLRQLEKVRSLSLNERRWLAGQLRLSNNAAASLEQWELVVLDPASTGADWESVADLRAEAGNVTGALDAYTRARRGAAPASAELAMARLLATSGRFRDAVDAYARYLQDGSPLGKRLELARAHLAAAEFAEAERWAREAATTDEQGAEAELVLAQALYLRDKRGESDAILARLPKALPPSARVYEQAGQLAAAKDQHLRGIRWFDRALALEPSNEGELRYWQGLSALKRGDVPRALASLDRTRELGAVPELARLARRDAERLTAPTLWFPTRGSDDSNDLSTRQAGVGFTAWPGRHFPFSIEAVTGTLTQQTVSFGRDRATIGVGRALVRPQLGLGGYVGAERYDGRDSRVVGSGHGTFYFEDRSALRVELRRDSIWTERDRRDPRQFVRAIDLARLGPDFTIRGGEVMMNKTLGTGREARLQGGVNAFQDGNTQGFVYGHYQFVIDDRPGRWTALRPNVYWESFDRTAPGYFSPNGFWALGGMWHSIRSSRRWKLEAEASPRLTWLDGGTSYGFHGVLDLSRDLGPVSAGIGTFTFYDRRSDYWSWRLAGQVGLRLGR